MTPRPFDARLPPAGRRSRFLTRWRRHWVIQDGRTPRRFDERAGPRKLSVLGPNKGRRHGPNSDVMLVAISSKLSGRPCPHSTDSVARQPRACRRAAHLDCRLSKLPQRAELLNYQLRLFRPDAVQLVGGSVPRILISRIPCGTPSSSSGCALFGGKLHQPAPAHRSGAALIAIADAVALDG